MSQKDKFGRHEILDRTHVILSIISDHLDGHMGLYKDEAALVERAEDSLGKLYQLVSSRMDEKPKRRKKK